MRNKKSPQGSFDLFLDIVCNTFGGILFIALLVVILTRMIVQKDARYEIETVPIDAVLSAENRLQALQDEEDRLLELAATFQQSVSPNEISAQNLFELENKRDALLKTKTAQSRQLVDNIKSVAEAENLWNEKLKQLEQLETRYRRQQEVFFESVVKNNLQSVGLPQMRDSYKRKVALVLMGDKLFFWHKTLPNGMSFGLNNEQFVAFDCGEYFETAPKPWAGFPVSNEANDQAVIVQQLQKFNKSQMAFDVIVFRDSFDSFSSLRNAMVENGFEYTIFPMKQGQQLIDRGGTAKPVQ